MIPFNGESVDNTVRTFEIEGRRVGEGKSFLIAEVAQAHDGSLGMAHAMIDAIAKAGADAVKFQTHIAAEESTFDEPFRVHFSRQDATRYDYWRRMEFTPEQWSGLRDHACERGLAFLSSAFSVAAFKLLDAIGVPAWKVGSGEVASPDLLDCMKKSGKPVLLSTGMSNYDEISALVKAFCPYGTPLALFQCTSRYPVPLSEVGLNVLGELRRRFSCPVGLSDHSGKPFPALAALARGANLIEVHVTFDRNMFGPDTPASLTFSELEFLAQARDAFAEMDDHPVDKNALAKELAPTRALFGKSVVLAHPAKAGTVLTRDMLALRKPASGIPPTDIEKLIGLRLMRDLGSDRLLRWEDVSLEAQSGEDV